MNIQTAVQKAQLFLKKKNFKNPVLYSQILNLPGFVGLLTSFVVGYISLKWLLKGIESGKLYLFGSYCIVIGLITINF